MRVEFAADPWNPSRASLGGGNLNSTGHHVVQLTLSGGTITATQDALDLGLPDTLVYGLAVSPDGTMLFAATEVGAFWHDPAQNLWIDLTTPGAPEQVYWHVDVVPQLGIARFSTYGRGLCDLATPGLGGIFSNGFE